MTTMELKNILIHEIEGIEDISFLTAIRTIIEAKSEATIYKTNAGQRNKISVGLSQAAQGITFSNEQVDAEMNQWLKEK